MAKFRQKMGLLRGLLSRRFVFAGPVAVTVNVTRRCNLRCLGCFSHSPYIDNRMAGDLPSEDLDFDMFGRLCRELQTMGTGTLVICGDGEPLLHPQLVDMIRLAKGSGFRTVLLTNGTLIDEAKARALVDTGIDLVRISFWAATPDDYEKACPGASGEYFVNAVKAVDYLTSAKDARRASSPCVALHLIINRYSVRGIDSFIDLALKTDCDFVSFSPLHTVFGQLDSFGLSRQEESVLKVRLGHAKKKLGSFGVRHNIDETLKRYEIGVDVRQKIPCYIGWMQCRIKTDGMVQPCNPCRWPMGTLRERSLREIWTGSAYEEFRERILFPDTSATIDERCDCSFCCYLGENLRVHNLYKWLSPLSRIFGKSIKSRVF